MVKEKFYGCIIGGGMRYTLAGIRKDIVKLLQICKDSVKEG